MPPLNLDLHFYRPAPAQNRCRLRVDSPAGQTSADVDLTLPAPDLSPQEAGAQLFRAVFGGQAGALLRRSLDRAEREQALLRIRVRVADSPELADLPWEELYDPDRGRFLALSERCSILRYLETPDPPPPLAVPDQLRILCVLASPDGLDKLDIEGEWTGLNQELAAALDRGDMALERLHPPTLDALRRRLRQDPPVHLLHFTGHGLFDPAKGGMVVLDDGQGGPARVSAADLAITLRNAPSLRLTFLNACEGALSGPANPFTGVAGALVRGEMPAVIAMQREITDRGGIAFAREVYAALADGLSVDAAITQGRMALHSLGDHEWPIPVFFTRAPDDRLFGPDPSLADRHFTVPFPRNHGFVGREEDLAQLHTALQGAETVGIRPAGLTGQGGIGKTQLAVEYCYRHFHDQDDYPGGVFWVNAAEEWRQGFAALGRRVEPDCAERPTEQQIQAVARYLRGHTDALLVLDNVADPARLLRPVIPELIPADLPGPVLFTTRRRDLGRFQPVEVSVLPPAPALTLLLSHPSRADVRQPHHPEHATAQGICRILGGLPLALEIAAAHLGKRPTQPVAAYRDALLNRGALAVVDDRRGGVRDEDLGTRHAAAVAATLAEQWELVQSEDARLLLRIAGQLPEASQIPTARLGLLADISDADDGFFGSPLAAALDELADISLIEALADDATRLHPLVREFAAALTLSDQRSRDRECWAANLLAGYSRIATLQDHCTRRGLHPVELDLLAALDLLESKNTVTQTDLQALYRTLTLYGHELRDWQRHSLPAFFVQQICNRLPEGHLAALIADASAFRDDRGEPFLDMTWSTIRSSPALLRVLTGHEGWVSSVVMTPDGRKVVSASHDDTLRVWNLTSGMEERVLTGHKSWVRSVAVTPDGRRAVSASDDRTLRVWNLTSGAEEWVLIGHEGYVNAVVVTPDGRRAVSASDDCTLRVWDLTSGAEERVLTGHVGAVNTVAVMPDGQRAVSASDDCTLRVWDLERGESVAVLTGHEFTVMSVAVTPDGRRAVSASHDWTVRVWDLERGESMATLTGHEGGVDAVAVTPDGRWVVSASMDRTVRIWDLASGVEERVLTGHEYTVSSVAVTPDGQQVVSASYDETLRVWDISAIQASGVKEPVLTGHKSAVNAVTVTPNGRRAVSASDDQTVRVWDLERGESVATLTGHEGWVKAVVVTPDGQQAISASYDRTVRVWDLERGESVATLTGHESGVNAVVVTPDGRRAVSAAGGFLETDDDNTLRVWDLARRESVATLTGHEDQVRSVAVTPDGRRVVSASYDRTVRVWDLERSESVTLLTAQEFVVNVVAVTPDGRRVVLASLDPTVRVWNLTSGAEERVLIGHEDQVNNVAVTPDGRRAVSASDDWTVRVWDLETGRQLAVIALDGAVFAVAVAPDGVTIVAGDQGGNVYCLTYQPGRNG